ncbi:hypothetical protein [Synechocystis salina]|nr:hypothetical protein [Synechocystis salina]
MAQGAKIKVHAVEAPFLDIGTPTTLAQAGEFIQSLGMFDQTDDQGK